MIQTDICVIGAGPSGSTIASLLAGAGHKVILVESHAIPRDHVGESLSPAILPLLHYLGVINEFESSDFLPFERTIVAWGGMPLLRSQALGSTGYQVDRGAFDSILVEKAKSHGVQVLSSTRVTSIARTGSGSWNVKSQSKNGAETIRCVFVVDAAGRCGIVAPRRRMSLSCALMGIYGYWRNVPIKGTESRIEAGSNRWYWGAPLPAGRFNATVFVDPRRIRSANDLLVLYQAMIGESALLEPCLQGDLVVAPRVRDSTPSMAEEVVGKGWIKCGESAFTIDPLSSQGVQSAISNSIQAAAVVATMFDAPENTIEMVCHFYRDRVQSSALRNAALARRLYRDQAEHCPREFWTKRAEFHIPDLGATGVSKVELNDRSLILNGDTWSTHGNTGTLSLSPDVAVVQSPIIDGLRVRLAQAIVLPGESEPIAFVGNVHISHVLEMLRHQPHTASVWRELHTLFDRTTAAAVYRWVLSCGIAVFKSDHSDEKRSQSLTSSSFVKSKEQR